MLSANEKITVPFWMLACVYAILPLLLILALVDALFLQNALRETLPRTPETFVLYALLFGTPHILASFFSLADRDYLAAYGTRLTVKLPLLLISIGLITYFFTPVGILIFVAYTMYHVVFQQAGLSLVFGAKFSKAFGAWRALPVLFITMGHMAVYYPDLIAFMDGWSGPLLTVLVSSFVLLSFYLYGRIPSVRGKLYFAATSATFVGSYLLYLWGYPLFSILLVRFVHDVTAFIIYAAHDHNRAVAGKTNLIYRFFPKRVLPVFLATPLLAIMLGYVITHPPFSHTGFMLILLLGIAHYYIESFVWKRDTIHRSHVSFA